MVSSDFVACTSKSVESRSELAENGVIIDGSLQCTDYLEIRACHLRVDFSDEAASMSETLLTINVIDEKADGFVAKVTFE